MKAIILIVISYCCSISINAQCVKGNCIQGKGKIIYKDKSSYEGNFSKGARHGKGLYLFKGGKYTGTFLRNKMDGEGKLTFYAGESYIGQFKLDMFHGKGKYIYANGDIYKGHWQEGKKEGFGTYVFHNADTYIGLFVNDKMNGQGNPTKSNQVKESGNWENGVLVNSEIITNAPVPNATSTNNVLQNCNEQNCHETIGRYTYSDGSVYEGMFLNNQPEGQGICLYINGNKYQGGWKNHSPHGPGIITFTSGKKYSAEWHYGNPIKEMPNNSLLKPKLPNSILKKEFDKTVDIYACIIGIASYSHMPSLKYTDDDAYHLYAFLKSPDGGAIKDKNINLLIDDAATKLNILANLQSITEKADSNDVVLVYLSGHGLEGSYIPSDFDGHNNNLPYFDIIQILDNSAAKHTLCIADACYSGSIANSKNISFQGLQTYYSLFNKLSGGTAFLASSKSEEVSLEYSGLRHGVFSHFLIEGLKGNADSNSNNIVTIQELYNYVTFKVQNYTNNAQTPTLSGDYNPKMPISNTFSHIESI